MGRVFRVIQGIYCIYRLYTLYHVFLNYKGIIIYNYCILYLYTICLYVQISIYARFIHIFTIFIHVKQCSTVLYYGHKQKIQRRGAAIIPAGYKFSKIYRFRVCVNCDG
nr:MAG TPA: hypothetical protein [Caudoviricetes sp.]